MDLQHLRQRVVGDFDDLASQDQVQQKASPCHTSPKDATASNLRGKRASQPMRSVGEDLSLQSVLVMWNCLCSRGGHEKSHKTCTQQSFSKSSKVSRIRGLAD